MLSKSHACTQTLFNFFCFKKRIVLRIITNDVNAVCRFSMKFGADMATSYKLIDLAIQLNLDLVGIRYVQILSLINELNYL